MMIWRTILHLTILLAIGSLPLFGAVFDLRDEEGQSTLGSGRLYPNPICLWDEPIILNGYHTRLTLDVSQAPAQERLAFYQKAYPNATYSSTTFPVQITLAHAQTMTRILILELFGKYPTIEVKVEIPYTLPTPSWPRMLPRLAHVQLQGTTSFPERETHSASFTQKGEVSHTFGTLVRQCEDGHFQFISGGFAPDKQSATALFYDPESQSCLLLGLTNDAQGQSEGLLMRVQTQP